MKNFITYWPLVKKLTLREIKARYKQSFMGFFWIILNPFFQMLILSFVFSKVLKFTNIGIPFPLFLYAGLLPWTLFSSSLSSGISSLESNASLIKQIYFPREILILSTLLAKVFDFLLAFSIFFIMMIYYQIPFSLYILLILPILLIQFIFTYGLSLLLSAANLFYRDVQYLFGLLITMWFYLTPVIYPTEIFPQAWRWIFMINPMAVFINAYREVLFNATLPKFSSLGIGLTISLILLLVSYIFFKKLEKTFADVV